MWPMAKPWEKQELKWLLKPRQGRHTFGVIIEHGSRPGQDVAPDGAKPSCGLLAPTTPRREPQYAAADGAPDKASTRRLTLMPTRGAPTMIVSNLRPHFLGAGGGAFGVGWSGVIPRILERALNCL